MKTLVINNASQPLMVISWQDAIRLIYRGKARVEKEYDEVVTSISVSMNKPAVIMLDQYINPYKIRARRFNRRGIFVRDAYTCQYCGYEFTASYLTLDHVVPKSKGGARSWENIVTACHYCNNKKADLSLEKAGMTLLSRPHKPLFPAKKGSVEEWHEYLYG
jgi:5-methylcytosine-specific restriction endonuclease McrA